MLNLFSNGFILFHCGVGVMLELNYFKSIIVNVRSIIIINASKAALKVNKLPCSLDYTFL